MRDVAGAFVERPVPHEPRLCSRQLTRHRGLNLFLRPRNLPQAHFIQLSVQRVDPLGIIPHRERDRVRQYQLADDQAAVKHTVEIQPQSRAVVRFGHVHPRAKRNRRGSIYGVEAIGIGREVGAHFPHRPR